MASLVDSPILNLVLNCWGACGGSVFHGQRAIVMERGLADALESLAGLCAEAAERGGEGQDDDDERDLPESGFSGSP